MRLANIILVVAIAVGVVFLSGLGVWQVKRLAWKEALIERVETNLSAPPLSLSEIDTMRQRGEDFEYRPVKLAGEFDHSGEQHFFATHKGSPGYFVYTPLKLDTGSFIFVNRGYVPLEQKSPDNRTTGQVTGRVEIEGLARSAPDAKPNSFVPDNDLAKNVYYWKSLKQMSVQSSATRGGSSEVMQFFVDAGEAANPGGLPKGGVTLIEFPNSHLQYAITWFGLAATLLVVGGFFLFGRILGNSPL